MIQAIETKYKGYRFRSRLEARWAVFFDACGYSWEYEPEGFKLDDGTLYLPDFRLKDGREGWGAYVWAEVKGCENQCVNPVPRHAHRDTSAHFEKAKKFAISSGQAILLLAGPPDGVFYQSYEPDGGMDCYVFSILSDRPIIEQPLYFPTFWNDAALERAVEAARSARFEHGETPL